MRTGADIERGRRRTGMVLASVLALVVCGCQRREDAPPPPVAPPAAPLAVGARPGTPPAPPPPPAAADEAALPGAAPAGEPPSIGDWLEGNIYRMRLDAVRTCPPIALAGFARIGVAVRVTSKLDELFVAPRDFKLESGGVILESAVLEKAPAACAPLLAPKSLRAGKTADGVVVFDLPPGFNPAREPVRVAYQPTRWGGARRVEAVLPSASLPR